jgi:hypothetical protein
MTFLSVSLALFTVIPNWNNNNIVVLGKGLDYTIPFRKSKTDRDNYYIHNPDGPIPICFQEDWSSLAISNILESSNILSDLLLLDIERESS